MKYIKTLNELTEFNLQQFDNPISSWINQPNDPNLSFDAYDKHTDSVRMANIRLNQIIASLVQNGEIYNRREDRIIERQEIGNLVIQRMYSNGGNDLDIYIQFEIAEKEYFGVINNFIFNPKLKTEAFRDPDLILTKEWVIRTTGLIIKAIKKWLNIEPGTYKALKELYVTCNLTGTLYTIKQKQEIKVLRCLDDKIIANIGSDIQATLDGTNFYYFNYFFQKIES